MKNEKEEEKEISFKDEVVEYFKSLYKRSNEFIKNNKIELSILFIVLFLYFLLTDIKTKNTYCNVKGGAPTTPQQQQQQQQQQIQQQQQKKQQELYQVKSQMAQIGFSKISNTIASSTIMSDIVCYIMSFLKTGVSFFSIVFAVMMIPGVPVFGFMILLFAALRGNVADIKAL